jgi:hypothetical protein
MAKEKFVEKNISEEELEKAAETISNIKGHYMSFVISTEKVDEKDWQAEGKMKIASTLDGEHWGEMEMAVKGFDSDSNSALATVMVSLNNYINSTEFIMEMANKINKALEEEAKLPESLE